MSTRSPVALEALIRRDRLIVAASLLGVAALAWYYLVDMSLAMPGMSVSLGRLADVGGGPWTFGYGVMIFLMWVVMMVGMMLPSATPAILLFGRVAQHSGAVSRPVLRSYLFVAGYLLAWVVFSLAATLLQWGVESMAAKSARAVAAGPVLGGALLVVAGIYQWTPLKQGCLKHCRGPVDFLTRHWRPGLSGALRMGAGHGLFCVGCCWVLMLLLFAGGVMNLLLVAAITVFVLLEKLMPYGDRAGHLSGLALVVLGVVALARIAPSPG